jgi:integrase
MTKSDPATTITKATLQAALRDAMAGADYVRRDPACPGLELRVRYHKVSWTIRCRMNKGGKQRRFDLGDGNVLPEEARRRGQKVKDLARQGLDPTGAIVEMKTGVSVKHQREEAERRGQPSIEWAEARTWFLEEFVRAKRSIDTYDSYRKELQTPELAAFDGRMVADITKEDVAEVLKLIAARGAESLAEHVQRALSSMWTQLADPAESRRTGVRPYAIKGAKAPERTTSNPYAEDAPDYETLDAPPTELQIGRAIAIAKSGALGLRNSAAILILAGSVQRRRTVAGGNRRDFRTFGDEMCWAIPPFFRKTAKKKRSRGKHVVPLVGWAATAAQIVERLAGDGEWHFPAGKTTRKGKPGRTPHINARWISAQMEVMPDIGFSAHKWRAAFATHGPALLGWSQDDAKIILDHLEGHDGGDVTAQHYNSDPQMQKKRKMMTEWIAFLDRCEGAAVTADPVLRDPQAIAEAVYRRRWGEECYQRTLKRAAHKDGKLPWSGVERMVLTEPATVESLEVWRKRKMPA